MPNPLEDQRPFLVLNYFDHSEASNSASEHQTCDLRIAETDLKQNKMSRHVFDAAAMQNAFQSLFTSLTPEKVAMLRGQRRTTPSSMSYSSEQNNVLGMKSGTTLRARNLRARAMTAGSNGPQKAIQAKARQVDSESKARKRPTNSFMTFRAYYSPQLRGLTQKAKSGLIRRMWAMEPRKHFFALLAKAHSEFRDNHSEQIKFENFLACTVGLLPIVPADSYLEVMGWKLIMNTAGEQELSRSGHPADQSLELKSNMSVYEIIEHCYRVGLVARPAQDARQGHNQMVSMESAMTMSFVVAPKVRAPLENTKLRIMSEAQQQLDPSIRERIEYQLSSDIFETSAFDFNDLSAVYRPSIQTVTTNQQHAYDNYPFTVHFHPDAPTVVGFDPRMAQDDFDPFSFDLGDYVNFDA